MGFYLTSIYIKFLDFSFFNFWDLNKFFTILLIFLLLTLLTTLLLSVLNTFYAILLNNLIIFNMKVGIAVILLKLQIKRW